MKDVEWQKKFAERLQQLIYEKDVSQAKIADKADITRQAMSCYFNGYRIPKANIVSRLAKALEVPVTELIELD